MRPFQVDGLAKTYSTEKLSRDQIGFVFDIDGVLIKGKRRIEAATKVLTSLAIKKIPFVLLTNGGGMLEAERVARLNKVLGLVKYPVNANQIVLSHTPLRTLVTKHKRILVVGGPADKSREVALHYGFKEVLRPVDIIRANPNVCPFHRYTKREIEEWALDPSKSKVSIDGTNPNEPIDSIMVFNDPRELYSDIQIVMDLLNSQGGLIGTRRITKSTEPSVPIIFSNNDFLWANDFPIPRLGQGAVKIAIQSLYANFNDGRKLESLTLGKPYRVSYDYAHHILIDWRSKLASGDLDSEACLPELNDPPIVSPFKQIYMIGDNPESDILGGNNYGWNTILVRTGVYKDGDFVLNPGLAEPNFGIYDNVLDGVSAALASNGIDPN